MQGKDETQIHDEFKRILLLGKLFQHVFFKDFFQEYDLPEGLNQTHTMALMMLRFSGPTPMSEVSQRLNLEKGSFTPVANKLIQLDYLSKQQSEKDRRVFELSLTEKGKALANDLSENHFRFTEALLDSLDSERREAFLASSKIISEILMDLSNNFNEVEFHEIN